MGNAVSVAILISVAVIIVVIVALVLLRSTPNPTINTPTKNPGTLLQPCAYDPAHTTPNVFGSTGICDSGYICEGNNVCVSDLGTICNTLSDCSSQATVCSGRCSNEVTGGLNQLCPCTGLTRCVPQSDGYNRCKGLNGFPCTSTTDCVGMCINGFCSGGLAEGEACISQICVSGLYCDPKGFCQKIPLISGQQNAFCMLTGEPSCDPGLRCVDNFCNSTFGTLKSNCTAQFCNLPLTCTAIPPLPGNTRDINACLFNDNNICMNTCPANFTCTTVGSLKQCLGSVGQACISNSNCSNNSCNNMPGLLKWTGTTWQNISTPPAGTFVKMHLGIGVANTQSNVYIGGTTGLWVYNGTWTLLFPLFISLGTILDFSVSGTGNDIHLLVLNTSGITVVVDSNLNPISNFGTADGSLVVGSTSIVIANISFNNFGDIYVNTGPGNVYKNTTFLGNFGSEIHAYNATDPSANDFTVINNTGVQSFGELGNRTFPLFNQPAFSTTTYNKIANYDIYIEYIVDPGTTGSTGATGNLIPNAAASNIFMIASPDAIHYQIILNTGNLQTVYPGYVNVNSLVGTNKVDTYLYTPKVCT